MALTWSPVASLPAGRAYFGQSVLPDGNVLITGDIAATGNAHKYDFSTNKWTNHSLRDYNNISYGVKDHLQISLASGKVLIISGKSLSNTYLDDILEYNFVTGTSIARKVSPAAGAARGCLLQDGRVLVISNGTLGRNAAIYLYTPSTDTWQYVRDFGSNPDPTGIGVSLLLDGRVLLTGGVGSTGRPSPLCYIFDPATLSTTRVADMPIGLNKHGQSTLPDGRVLITGGLVRVGSNDEPTAEAYVYDPVQNTWTRYIDLPSARAGHGQSTLPDGAVFVVGGRNGSTSLTDTYVLPWNNAPSVTLTSPTNNQTIKQGTDVNFQWTGSDADGDALTYTLQVGTSAGASNIYNASVGSAMSKKGISTAWAVGLYYWRVIADDGKGGVTTSTEGVFGLAKGNLVAISPANSVVRDTRMNSTNASTNYGTENTIAIQGGSTIDRALQLFDLGLIPNNAVINSAVLKLYKESGVASSVNLHKVITDWVDTSATWAIAPSFNSTAVATLSFTATNGFHQFDLKTLVQDWINGDKNCGMLFKLPNEATSVNIQLSSANNPTVANRPVLEVDFSIPTTGKKQVEYVGSGAVASTASGTSISVPLAVGVITDDLLVAVIQNGSGQGNISTPSGWTLQFTYPSIRSSSYAIYTRFATSSTGNVVFSSAYTSNWGGRIHAFRNVKSIHQKASQAMSANTNFQPTEGTINATITNLLAAVFNSADSNYRFTPQINFFEVIDEGQPQDKYGNQVMLSYMHNKNSLTGLDMRSFYSGTGYGASTLFMLEPKTNTAPTLTLTSPANNLSLAEGNTMAVQGSATEVDSGNVVTSKYKINNGTVRALQSGVSNGSTPISFAKNLTYKGKRMWDGAVDVSGADLAENVDHTLTVWAEDDQGGKSTEVIRKFRVIWNRPPVISDSNRDLGILEAAPTVNYSVADPESNPFTVTEKLNGLVVRTFAGVSGRQETFQISPDAWLKMEPGVVHTLTIEATDDQGAKSTRIYTLTRFENQISFEIETPWTTDVAAKRVLLTMDMSLPPGAVFVAEATNNAFDAVPAWEDISFNARYGRGYVFQNAQKTAATWGVSIRVRIEKGTATEPITVKGFGGAFD